MSKTRQCENSHESAPLQHLYLFMLQAERQAVNTTVQGSAADIVKAAMNMIDQELVHAFPHTRFPHRHHDAGLRPACMRVCVCVCVLVCVYVHMCVMPAETQVNKVFV